MELNLNCLSIKIVINKITHLCHLSKYLVKIMCFCLSTILLAFSFKFIHTRIIFWLWYIRYFVKWQQYIHCSYLTLVWFRLPYFHPLHYRFDCSFLIVCWFTYFDGSNRAATHFSQSTSIINHLHIKWYHL